MRVAALLLLIACEKSGSVESTPGVVESSPAGSAVVAPEIVAPPDAAAATLPNDAAPVAKAPVDAGKPAADAARRPTPKPDDDEASPYVSALAFDGSRGAGGGDIATRPPAADLDAQIKEVKNAGRSVKVGNGSARDPGPTPVGRVTVASKQAFDDTSLKAEVVLAKLQSVYMAAIKRCYKDGLKSDPAMRGKIKLSFTVNESGRVIKPSAKGFASTVDDCIAKTMVNWVFPVPKDVDGEKTDAAFGITLALTPD